ncbi:MAG: M3 family metallopeptidase [candidate division Zixibacteria bacterium]|nr:M3 family metallopeptidase [candidate division Zixibacteria bacterium]
MPDTTVYNPLIDWTDIPVFDRIDVSHIEPAVRAVLDRSERRLAALETDRPDTWAGLMDELERIDDEVSRVWGVVSHLHGVKNSPPLRNAYQTLLTDVVKFGNRMGQSRPLYQAYCVLRDSAEAIGFEPAQHRILDSAIRDAEFNGVGLDEEKRKRFNEISERQAELSTRISNNVLDATKTFRMVLTLPEETQGLTDSLRELAADSARKAGHSEATAEAGPWSVKLDMPSYLPFMQYSKRRDLREKLYRAYVTRASEGEWDNSALITEMLALRREKAELLGFPSYAAMSLSRKMAGEVSHVEKLLDELHRAARPGAERDMEDLRVLARFSGAPEADDFEHWDTQFWAERLRESRYNISDEELRPYFPLPQVLRGMFDLAERLFGVQVIETEKEVPVWHEDVRYFRVVGPQGELVAGVYLDPYSRPEEKRGGAWMNVLVGRSRVMAPPDHPVRLPIAYMMCNQSRPVGNKPSLMTFREVETLFHEFGHALQHILTTVDYGPAAGISNVEWDAVEIASHFMENWCYDPDTLRNLARHYETGETLPDGTIERIRNARIFREGSQTLRQVNFGLFDLELHDRFKEDGMETVLGVQRRIDQETLILPALEEDRFYCAFTHIFAGGYAAGYYSYKWSEVLSADAFSAFLEAGLDNEQEIRRLGRKFRDTILGLGGSIHPMEVFRMFRGRMPSTEALLRQSGLVS